MAHKAKIKDEENISVEGSFDDVNEDFADFEPSFVDGRNQLMLGSEKVLTIEKEGRKAGYLVFQPKIGRISQIAVSRIFRNEGIGKKLLKGALARSQKPLTVMNVPESEHGFHNFLVSSGFENQINQFEMELII